MIGTRLMEMRATLRKPSVSLPHCVLTLFGSLNARTYGSRSCRPSAQMLGFASHFACPRNVMRNWHENYLLTYNDAEYSIGV